MSIHGYLKNCALFQSLEDWRLQRIARCSRAKTYSANSPICLPGGRVDYVFLLADGLVKVSHVTADGKEAILTFVETGELFGELSIFDGQPREELVQAVQASTVVMIPNEALRRLMSDRADVALGITKLIGLRRRRIERRLKNLLFVSNRDRLVHSLLELSEQFGVHAADGIRLRIKLSHRELANLIGSTRESVTVVLGQLKAEGSIKGGRCKLVISRPDHLAQSVNRQPPRVPRFKEPVSLVMEAT